MHKFEYILDRKNRFPKLITKQYPETWNEITKEQLLYVARLMNEEYTKEMFNTLLLMKFLKIKIRYFFKMSAEQIKELGDTVMFIHEKKELTLNKLPEITVRRRFKKHKLFGPDDACLNLTFEQFFGYCEPALNNYVQTKDVDSLNFLIASLYTFEKGNFNPDDIEKIKKLVKKLNAKYKTAILLFYLGSKDFFAYKFPKLFKAAKGKSNTQVSDLYFIELTDQLNNGVLSNNQQIKKSNILEAFQRLTKMIELSEELKKKK